MKKIYLTISNESGIVSWHETKSEALDFIKENEESLMLASANVKDLDVSSVYGCSYKYVLSVDNPHLEGTDRGYYEATATCGDAKFGLEWDILDSVDTDSDYDEQSCCDWSNPRAIYRVGYYGNFLDKDDFVIEWN